MNPTPHNRSSFHRPLAIGAVLAAVTLVVLLFNANAIERSSSPFAHIAKQHDYMDPVWMAADEARAAEPGVPVLCYHYFRGRFDPGYLMRVFGSVVLGMPTIGPREYWTTPIGEFEKHLQYFRETGTRVMTLDEVANLVEAGRPLPRRAVVLTIDDADESVYDLAWPLLEEYGVKAHVFVPTAHVGTEWNGLQVCSWDQLQEMAGSGHVILGSHSRDLHYKVKTPKGLEPIFWNPEWIDAERHGTAMSELARGRREHSDIAYPATAPDVLTGPWAPVGADLLASRYDLAARAGVEAEWLAWPYGFAHGSLDSIARLLGYRGTVSLKPRAFSERDSALAAGRYTLTAHSTLESIIEIVERHGGPPPLP